jgi:hypothetical protein
MCRDTALLLFAITASVCRDSYSVSCGDRERRGASWSGTVAVWALHISENYLYLHRISTSTSWYGSNRVRCGFPVLRYLVALFLNGSMSTLCGIEKTRIYFLF